MEREAIIAGIKEGWGDFPAADLSVQIANKLFSLEPEETQFLTYETLLAFAECDALNENILSAINILTTSRFAILEAHGQFIDDDGEEHHIAKRDFQNLLITNTLVHPITGEIISDAGTMVLPYFSLRGDV